MLESQGMPEDEIDVLIYAAETAYLEKTKKRLVAYRWIGIAIFSLGIALNTWGLFFMEASMFVSGTFVAVLLVGLFVTVDPKLLDHLPQLLGEDRSR